MTLRILFPLIFLLMLPGRAPAENLSKNEALMWLQRVATAAHALSYEGTFVYQHGDMTQTSRIAHLKDNGGEYEKLEILDGSPREIVRNNDKVFCYLPDQKAMIVGKRPAKPFPALLPKQLAGLTESYDIRMGRVERVAGFECQVVNLQPRDTFRYGHRLWAEVNTGLLVKASMLNEKGEVVDQYAFTRLVLNPELSRDQFRPRSVPDGEEWRMQPMPEMAEPSRASSEWVVEQLPVGFRKLTEMKRTMPGKKAEVQHLVYTDGLAAVSVFVEPAAGMPARQGLSSQGAIHVFARPQGNYHITVLGEVPRATVMQIGNSLHLRSPK